MSEAAVDAKVRGSRGRALKLLVACLVAAGLALTLLVTVFGARLDEPTVGLSVATAALVYALGQLYAMVHALAQPDRVAQVGRGAGSFTQSELRDEKRRLLRAIKELEFDRGMGKLSQQDFDTVIATYRLRAIEVMRALDGGGEVHPDLAKLLAERAAGKGPALDFEAAPAAAPTPAPAAAASALETTTRICGICNGINDTDARFCKHCGAPVKKTESSAPRPSQPAISGEIGGAG